MSKVKHNSNLRRNRQKTHVSSINGIMCIAHFSTKEAKLLERFSEFKLAYVNSIISDYKPSKVLKRGRVSIKSVNVIQWTVNEFIKRGWAEFVGNDLVLSSKKKLKQQYKCGKKLARMSVEVKPHESRHEYQSIGLKLMQNRCDYKFSHDEALSKISKASKDMALRSHKFRRFCGFVCELSYGYVSKATSVPSSTCRRAIKLMERKGIIKALRARRECLGKITQKGFEAIKEQGFYKLGYNTKNLFYHKGFMFYVPNNAYLLFPSIK